MDVLKQWQHQVLATRDVLWPEKSAEALVPTRSVPMLAVHDQQAVEVSLHSLGGIQIGSVRVCLPSTVRNLLQAEATLRNLVVEELKAWDLKGNQVDPSMSISEDMALIIGSVFRIFRSVCQKHPFTLTSASCLLSTLTMITSMVRFRMRPAFQRLLLSFHQSKSPRPWIWDWVYSQQK